MLKYLNPFRYFRPEYHSYIIRENPILDGISTWIARITIWAHVWLILAGIVLDNEFQFFETMISIILIIVMRWNIQNIKDVQKERGTTFYGILNLEKLNIYNAVFKGKNINNYIGIRDPFQDSLIHKKLLTYIYDIGKFSHNKDFNSAKYMKIQMHPDFQKNSNTLDLPF